MLFKPDQLNHYSTKVTRSTFLILSTIDGMYYVVTKFSFQEDRSSVSVGDTNYSNILVQTFFTTRNIIFFFCTRFYFHIDVFTRWILHIKYREKHQKASS